jgi:hypothetical protein
MQLDDGWVRWSCDHASCGESVEFRPTLEETAAVEVRDTPGAAGPEGWGMDLAGDAPRHLCPAHADEPPSE